MNFSFYVAKRYLFAKKSQNTINVISTISVVGVSIGTMALIVVLSVFNGFDSLVHSLFNSFDPDLKITIKEGKRFSSDLPSIEELKNTEGVLYLSEVVEENALLKYGKKQYIATIKGVSEDFLKMSGIDTMIIDGNFSLKQGKNEYAVVGQGIAIKLTIGLNFVNPIVVYVPKREGRVSMNPEKAFNRRYIFPSGIFAIQQDFDSRYMIVPIEFARELLDFTTEVSALEIKIDPAYDSDDVQARVKEIMGESYDVKNRFEQEELLYKIMKTEKWAIFFILTFILVVASFNVIGSLTMLIIEKKKDISILRSMGAEITRIRNIFLYEGWLISVLGAITGLTIGVLIIWLQKEFGLIKLQGSGSFVIDTYPVEIVLFDFILVFITVIGIGYLAAWYPVRYITRKYVKQNR
ncbi:MAG: FtsX-like permease family protein [Bacteroidales bacterium]|nr:FtsX-like permease family protein [Bacteroidales bacterium]